MAQLKATTINGALTVIGTATADGLTLGANELITLGAQTLKHDGTDFVFNDSVNIGTNTLTAGDITSPKINSKRFNQFWSTDFLYASIYSITPWYGGALASGTNGQIASPNTYHPGVGYISSSTSTNSGYYFTTSVGTAAMRIGGGETTQFIFKLSSGFNISASTNTVNLGFLNTVTGTPTYGAYANITGDGATIVLTGITVNNSSATSSATYAIAVNTWYNLYITVNSDLSNVNFRLTASPTAGDLWNVNNTTNIPVSGSSMGHGLVARTTATTATELMQIDYMDLGIDRILLR